MILIYGLNEFKTAAHMGCIPRPIQLRSSVIYRKFKMASNAVALWQQVVELLQDGVSRDDMSLYSSINALDKQLRSLLPLPQSTCKTLVQQLQVRSTVPPCNHCCC